MLYTATISWKRGSHEPFVDNKYSRGHRWKFDGGIEIDASSSAHIVPLPYSREDAVDPEEAFVASLSSCHMLTFLSIAAGKRFLVEQYIDQAEGVLAKNADGILVMTEVTLKPQVTFGGERIPTAEQLDQLHHLAHQNCFIANSVKTNVKVEPTPSGSPLKKGES